MSDQIDDAAAERITRNIDRTFRFLGDVRDDPSLLDKIPSGSALAFRETEIEGHAYRLAASRPAAGGAWAARITSYTLLGGATAPLRPILDGRSLMHDLLAVVHAFDATGPTAAAALDALEEKIRTAIGEAVRADAEGSDRGSQRTA